MSLENRDLLIDQSIRVTCFDKWNNVCPPSRNLSRNSDVPGEIVSKLSLVLNISNDMLSTTMRVKAITHVKDVEQYSEGKIC
jgi:hypothetical protein